MVESHSTYAAILEHIPLTPHANAGTSILLQLKTFDTPTALND